MIARNELKKISKARLKEAEVLFHGRCYDGAAYICGYALEVALKARICRTLKWIEYPETNREFSNYQSFRTHNLDVLLHLSGCEEKVKLRLSTEWSIIQKWSPADRYKIVGSAKKADTHNSILAAKKILKEI